MTGHAGLIKREAKMLIRSLKTIAAEITSDWRSLANSSAKPYVEAMAQLQGLGDKYHLDSAVSIVAYFLGTAGTWRGPVAKRVKAELRAMMTLHNNSN